MRRGGVSGGAGAGVRKTPGTAGGASSNKKTPKFGMEDKVYY